ncbi:MAG: AsmA family protein [Acidobacteria bacterium]|nr:AsmA family protein [Acidobacteriota bacterium]
MKDRIPLRARAAVQQPYHRRAEHRGGHGRRKWIIGFGAMLALAAAIFLIPRLIDINRYRDRISNELEQRLGRHVTLGSLSLSLFPSVRIQAKDASIDDDPQYAKGTFVKARSIDLRLGLWSLLTGDPRLHSIDLVGPDVILIKAKRASWNWSTLKPLEIDSAGSELPSIDIRIEDGRFTLIDQTLDPASERTYTGIQLTLENFASNQASRFKFVMTMPGDKGGQLEATGSAGPIDSAVAARTPLDVKLNMRQVELAGLESLIGLNAPHAGRLMLEAELKGRLTDRLQVKGELKVEAWRFAAGAEPARSPLETEFELAATSGATGTYGLEISKADIRIGSTRVTLTGRVYDQSGAPTIELQAAGDGIDLRSLLESAGAFGVGPPGGMTASGSATVNIKATGPWKKPSLTGNAALSELKLQSAKWPEAIEIGTATLRFMGDRVRAEVPRARVAGSLIQGWCEVRDFQHPAATFDLKADQLILSEMEKLMASRGAVPFDGPWIPAVQAWTERPIAVLAEGNVAIQKVVLENVTLTDLQSHVWYRPPGLNLNPLSFSFYGGRYQGELTLEQLGGNPVMALAGRFGGVDVNQFLNAATPLKNVFYGRADGTLDVRGRGKQLEAKTLTGSGRLSIHDGRITSFDLARQVEILGRLAGLPLGGAGTEFRALKSDLRFENGKVHTENMKLEMNDMSVTGRGILQLGDVITADEELMARLSPALTRRVLPEGGAIAAAGTFFLEQEMLSVPIRMSGPVTQPRFSLSAEVMQKRLTERFTRQPQQAIKDLLDVFKRKGQSGKEGEKKRP